MIALIGITIDRKVTSSSRNASPNTKAKISGSLLFSLLAKSSELAASPVTLTVVPSTPDRRRDDVIAQLVQCVDGLGVVSVAGGRDVDLGYRAVLAVDDLGSGPECIEPFTSLRSSAMPPAAGPERTSSASTTTVAVTPSVGKTSLTLL